MSGVCYLFFLDCIIARCEGIGGSRLMHPIVLSQSATVICFNEVDTCLEAKRPLHTGVRKGFHYLICLHEVLCCLSDMEFSLIAIAA